MQEHILIAEDDVDLAELLRLYLERGGYAVGTAYDGLSALEMLRSGKYSMALVDIMMPKLDGYGLIREIRRTHNIPIIILSALTLDKDKVTGLEVGADAYITKPFNPIEVLAYVKALYRRYSTLGAQPQEDAESGGILTVQDLTLDTQSFVLKKGEKQIPLTTTELRLLSKLMQNPGRILTKAQLYSCINDQFFDSDSNTVMVHISKLRFKLEDDPAHPRYITTVRGLGYKLEKEKRT